jgi:predicted ATPase/class 3 adenylate cyclase
MSVERTFLFSDIEGSTRKWEEHASLMPDALARHDALMTAAIARRDGLVVKHTGDGLLAVFTDPANALNAAADAQRALGAVPASVIEPLKVRIGVHCGPAVQVGSDFFGSTLNRCARLMAVAHGGQVVLSDAVVDAIGMDASAFDLLDLGSHQLRDVLHPVQVFQLVGDGMLDNFPPLKTVGKSQHNLPEPVSSFIGRVKVLEEVDDAMAARRLVTIVGPGGCGKTRLAVEAAAARVSHHADGAWLVELAEVPAGGAVAGAVAAVLRVQEEMDRPIADTVCARLERSELLLVLDNCEHVIADAAEFAGRLLESCPGVRVLATSREPLGVPGEAMLTVDPLEVPGADNANEGSAEAVRLFIDRAVLVRPDFSPVGEELAAVARLCRQLEGIPLAIELAAARLNVLSVSQLERRLDQRFALLTGSTQRSARHRTLRATVEWSFELLSEAEQRAWAALSVFIGGFDLDAATFMLEADEFDTLDLLSGLVNRSILQASVGAGDVRYRMLETMREFGREKLAEADALEPSRARQRAWALDLAVRAEPEHMTNSGPEWHNRFDLEYPNLRLAIESGLEDGAPDDSLRLCADLGIFFWLRGHLAHGRDWCERSLAAAPEADPGLRARALLSFGELAFGQLDFPASAPALEEAARIAAAVDDQPTIGWANMFLAVVYASRGDEAEARGACEEALRVAETHVIPSVRAGAYYWVGAVNATLGDEEEATKYLDLAVELARTAGSPYTLARFLPLIARRLHAGGDHKAAMVAFEEAIELSRAAGDRVGLARSLQYMAERHILSGDYDAAAARLEEAQPIVSREIDDATLACRVELTSATLWRHRGNAIKAQAHLDRALAWAGGLQGWRTSMDPFLVQAELAVDRGDMSAALEALECSDAFGRQANHAERVARASLLAARVLAELGRLDEAARHLRQASDYFGASEDPMYVALLAQSRGWIRFFEARYADAASEFEAALDAATTAQAGLLTVECMEDFSLAMWTHNSEPARAADLVAQATDERMRMGTPRPAPRAAALEMLIRARVATERAANTGT